MRPSSNSRRIPLVEGREKRVSKIALSWRLAVLVPALATAGAVLAACGSGNNALPGTTSTSTSTSASNTAGDTWFTSVKSCEFLDQSHAAALGFKSSGSVIHEDSSENSCDWNQAQFGDLQVVLEPLLYSKLNGLGNPVNDVTIADRPGKIVLDPVGGCDLAIEATSGSRAHIIVSLLSGGGDAACSIAKQAAQDIAPKLPSLSS